MDTFKWGFCDYLQAAEDAARKDLDSAHNSPPQGLRPARQASPAAKDGAGGKHGMQLRSRGRAESPSDKAAKPRVGSPSDKAVRFAGEAVSDVLKVFSALSIPSCPCNDVLCRWEVS